MYNFASRERIIKDYKKAVKQKEIPTYSINNSIVCRIIKRFNEGSPSLETEHKGGRPRKTHRFTDRKNYLSRQKESF